MKNISENAGLATVDASDSSDAQAVVVKKGKGGFAPRMLTREEVIEVGALASYLSKEQIADYLGFSRETWYDIEKRQPYVLTQYKNGKAKAIQGVAKGLIRQAHDGNTAAAIFYLKTQAGWKETQVVENTHKFDKNLDDFYKNEDIQEIE